MSFFFADVGLPLIMVQMPQLVALLPVVICVEVLVAIRQYGIPARQAWAAIATANCVTTLIGFPVVWFAMAALEILTSLILSVVPLWKILPNVPHRWDAPLIR